MKHLLFLTLPLIFAQCTETENMPHSTSKNEHTPAQTKDRWTCKAVAIEDKGWGYQLFRGSHLEINQKNVPAVNGLFYFETEAQALFAAEYAISKIEQGLFPPTVSPEELDSIGAIDLDAMMQSIEQ